MGKVAPRKKVFNDPGHAHELTFSTYRRTRLLEDVAHCRAFLRNLDRARKEWKFQVWAYVLMPDHVHLLLWPTEPVYNMADIRQSIKQPFAKAALARMTELQVPRLARLSDTRRRHFWQLGGGYDRNMRSAAACKKSLDYIHDNPVVARLCALPWEYEWSSAAWYHGLRPLDFEVDEARYGERGERTTMPLAMHLSKDGGDCRAIIVPPTAKWGVAPRRHRWGRKST